MLRGFFKFLNIAALIVLLASCMATHIEPQKYWQLAFIGFAFPVVLIVNFFFLLLWILKRDAFGLISLVSIALTYTFVQSSFATNFREENKEEGVKLMTWNVKNFDLYDWNKHKQTRKEMFQFIENENPHILCMQEFFSDNKHLNNEKYLTDTLGYAYHYFQPTTSLDKKYKSKAWEKKIKNDTIHRKWGVAIFSKYKIISTGRIDFENSKNNDCIYADIEIDGKPLRVYAVHFQSIYLGRSDYAVLDSLEETQKTQWTSLKNILRKMKWAYTKRAQQANAVAESINQFSGPKILCGDFNDVPVSYTYATAKGNLKDAFVIKGKGFGTTYANRFSIFRIDYALFDAQIKINSYKTVRRNLSDHYPVITTFSM